MIFSKKFIIATTMTAMLSVGATSAFAAVNGFVTEKDGVKTVFDAATLRQDFINSKLGLSAPLYDAFKNAGSVVALSDDKNGYIAYQDVLDAFLAAKLAGQDFVADQYTEGSEAQQANIDENTLNKTYVDENGQVVTEPVIAALNAINNAASAVETKTVLEANPEAYGIDLTEYNKLSSLNKLNQIAAVVWNAGTDYASLEEVKVAFDSAIGDYVVGQINAAADNPETADVNEALVAVKGVIETYPVTLGLDLAEYGVLEAAMQTQVVTNVFNSGTDYADDGDVEGAKTAEQKVKAAFDTKVAEVKAVVTINGATETNIINILENNALAVGIASGDLTNFKALSVDRKNTVAFTVLEGAPYENASAIKNAFDNALTTELATDKNAIVTAINNAADASQVKSLLESKYVLLGIDLTNYNALTEDTKTIVAETVLQGAPYANTTDVKNAFNVAVTNASVQSVNSAATAETMLTALTDNLIGLGLNPVDGENVPTNEFEYVTFGQLANQTPVLEALIGQNFVDAEAIQNAFDTAVLAQQTAEALAEVNAAANGSEMQIALQKAFNQDGLGLASGKITAYNGLDAMGKLEVATYVYDQKMAQTDDVFANATDVRDAFASGVDAQVVGQNSIALAAVNNAFTTSSMTNALVANALALGINVDQESVYNAIVNKTKMAQDMIAARDAADDGTINAFDTVDEVKAAFDLATGLQAVEEAANTTAMLKVLNDADSQAVLGLGADQITNFTTYQTEGNAKYSLANASEVAQNVIDARVAKVNDQGAHVALTQAEIAAAFDGAVDAIELEIAAADVLTAINNATSVDAVKTILDNGTNLTNLGLAATEFNKLSDKTPVYTAVYNGGANYASAADVAKVFNLAVALQAVNEATTQENMETVIETTVNANALGLLIGEGSAYVSLSEDNSVAQALIDNAPEAGYANAAAVRTVFDNAVSAQKVVEAVAAVNAATTATDMQADLEGNAALLGLETAAGSDYATFTSAGKLRVAQTVINTRPGGGFVATDAVGVEGEEGYVPARTAVENLGIAFNNAVAAEKAMMAVKNAADAQAMQTALEANAVALNLDMGTQDDPETTDKNEASRYYSLDNQSKVEIAQAVVAGKPYANAPAVKAIFDSAVTVQVNIEDLNDALAANGNVATAMGKVATLDKTGFDALSSAAQAYVIAELKDAAPFYTVATIQAALDTAVGTYSAVDEQAEAAALQEATTAVETAEGHGLIGDGTDLQTAIDSAQADHDAAFALVGALTDGAAKTDLEGRLTTVQSEIDAAQDALDVKTAEGILIAQATLNPVQGTDISVITMVETLINDGSITVTVSDNSGNAQIDASGSITYGVSEVTGNVLFQLEKGLTTTTVTLSVVVPATV